MGKPLGALSGLMRLGYLNIPDAFFFFFKQRCVLASCLSWSVQFVEGLGFQLTISLGA